MTGARDISEGRKFGKLNFLEALNRLNINYEKDTKTFYEKV